MCKVIFCLFIVFVVVIVYADALPKRVLHGLMLQKSI